MKDIIEITEYGVCRLALVAVRHSPNSDARQITELLFGEHYEVIRKTDNGNWLFIRIHFDGVEGWISVEQHHGISQEYFEQINHANFKITMDITCNILFKKSPLTILLGSIVPISNSELFKMEEQFAFNGEAKSLGQKRDVEFMTATAMKYLNAPEFSGGKSPFGIDAAGLVQMVFKIAGYTLPHSVKGQVKEGKPIKSLAEATAGDLAFFSRKNESVTHVGIVLSEEKIIHSFGRVRVDHLMEEGIMRADSKIYTHYLKAIRRVVISS